MDQETNVGGEHMRAGALATGTGMAGHQGGVMAEHLDAVMMAICTSMLGIECVPTEHRLGFGEDRVSAAIRVGGVCEGVCLVEMAIPGGDWLTDTLMGSAADWDDEMIDDAVGELCNMVTGGLKGRLGRWSRECRISLPEVWRGRGEVSDAAVPGVWRFYRVGGWMLQVGLFGWGE